jgi:hypothetical protein
MDQHKSYPDPNEYLLAHITQAADRYVQAIRKGGLQPSATLEKALAHRAFEEVETRYRQDCDDIMQHNISVVEARYREQQNQLKRDGAKMRLWTCPPAVLILGYLAWSGFSQSITLMGWVFTFGACAFLCMLVGGWIWDRPENE